MSSPVFCYSRWTIRELWSSNLTGAEPSCVEVKKGYLAHGETSGIQGRTWIRPEDIQSIADRKLEPAPPATTPKSDNFITCCK